MGIEENKNSNKLHQDSENFFQVIFDQAGIGMAIVNFDGYPIKTNFKLEEKLGYNKQELANIKFTDCTHPDDINLDWNLFLELFSGKRNSYQIEKRFLKKDGQIVWG
ncbi:MAG TPA: PAS domain S-box protein, partial [Desulfohalobiaceae bacterium]|nr:PAS domain S-box protein [Desulfohalobiaceae bacterium]